MNLKDALQFIHSTNKFGSILGLDSIKNLLEELNNPHKNLKYIHVAGTNGKGSTCNFIHQILVESNYKVGLFTSPYLETFEERIQINNIKISPNSLCFWIEKIKVAIDSMLKKGFRHPTEFEIVTALAFCYYNEQNVDFVVLEVGLGGRFDATNIIDSALVCVLTQIGMDHVDILGDTIEKISFEKAGIIKNSNDVLLYQQSNLVKNTIEKICRQKNATLHHCDFSSIKLIDETIDSQVFNYKEFKDLKICLKGKHQLKNASLAIEAIKILKEKGVYISNESIFNGLKNTNWPGRIEIFNKEPFILLDGAHNSDGAETLSIFLKENFSNYKINLVLGILKDKQVSLILDQLLKVSNKIFTTTVDNPRTLQAKDLNDLIISKGFKNTSIIENQDLFLKNIFSDYNNDEIFVFAGSLYLIGSIRPKLKKLKI